MQAGKYPKTYGMVIWRAGHGHSGAYTPGCVFPATDERSQMPNFQGVPFASHLAEADSLKQVAGDKGLTLVQLAIAWLLRLPAVTCLSGPRIRRGCGSIRVRSG